MSNIDLEILESAVRSREVLSGEYPTAYEKVLVEAAKAYLEEYKEKEKKEDIPVLVGFLNTTVGFRGYEKTGEKHPVYEIKDRYRITFKSVDSKPDMTVGYYKETLKPFIDFIKQ